MRYIVTIFWSFVIGQVVGYLGSALTSASYNFEMTTIVSLIFALIIILIGQVSKSKKTDTSVNHL